MNICNALHDLVLFGIIKKREKHPRRSVTFSKLYLKLHSSMGAFHVFKIIQMVPNPAKRHI